MIYLEKIALVNFLESLLNHPHFVRVILGISKNWRGVICFSKQIKLDFISNPKGVHYGKKDSIYKYFNFVLLRLFLYSHIVYIYIFFFFNYRPLTTLFPA